jgi:hypothetical protein
MASYRGHLMLSAPVGVAYGSLALLYPEFDWGVVVLGAGVATLGGLLPDLDSDSSVPIRELFSLAATITALIVLHRLRHQVQLPLEQALVFCGLAYLFVRYIVSRVFAWVTVHRGMFHSIPGMCVAGLVVYHLYPSPDLMVRLYLAGGTMVGFLSHLILDEIYSVDFNGLSLRFNRFAGSALKFGSSSWIATVTCYGLLTLLIYLAFEAPPSWVRPPSQWQLPTWPELAKFVTR